MKKSKGKHSIVLPVIILLCALTAMGIAGYKLYEHEKEENAGKRLYDELSAYAQVEEDIEETAAPSEGQASKEQEPAKAPKVKVDYNALQRVNPDTIGWLYCPKTVINYPVMKAKDYTQYLYHLPNGQYNRNGSLFLDYNCKSDLNGRLNIIYGHHMKSGRMFASIVGYKKQSYFNSHPYFYLYTKDQNYRIDLKYGCVVGAGEWKRNAFMYEENADKLIEYAKARTTFKSNAELNEGDQIMVLSTCSYEFDEARYIVLGKLRKV